MIEVTARLFFRSAVTQLGVAPLTSMFLFSEKNRATYDDFRPNVHDSDGLAVRRRDGDILWRPLNNPPRLASSYFGEENPQAFGLHQRKRSFDDYQDAEAHYELRPSVDVEPIGDWGKGMVRLVEIPTRYETNDNIVAFWVPEGQISAGDAREFATAFGGGLCPSKSRPTSPTSGRRGPVTAAFRGWRIRARPASSSLISRGVCWADFPGTPRWKPSPPCSTDKSSRRLLNGWTGWTYGVSFSTWPQPRGPRWNWRRTSPVMDGNSRKHGSISG